MEKKYKLTDETIEYNGVTLHRIEALKDFRDIKAGDKGGWVQSESNLSHEDCCWILDDARVYGNARVFEDSCVCSEAQVYGEAQVSGCAWICWKAHVYDKANISEHAVVGGEAQVYGEAYVFECANI